jgi:hypothetical protein
LPPADNSETQLLLTTLDAYKSAIEVTMPKRKGDVTLSGLIDLASRAKEQNGDQDMMLTPESAAEIWDQQRARAVKGYLRVRLRSQKKASRSTARTSSCCEEISRSKEDNDQATSAESNDQSPSDTEEVGTLVDISMMKKPGGNLPSP